MYLTNLEYGDLMTVISRRQNGTHRKFQRHYKFRISQ